MITLYDYQEITKEEIKGKLKTHRRCYLAAQERYGKTHTSFTAIKEMSLSNVLFVTVKQAMKGIELDYLAGNYPFKLTVINYESILKKQGDYDCIIFDEATKLAAFPKASKNMKMAHEVVKGCDNPYILWLNATPNVESYSQRYHQLQVAGFWKETNFYKWHRVYGIPHQVRRSGGILMDDYSKTKEYQVIEATKDIYIKGTREMAKFEHHETIFKEIVVEPTEQQTELTKQLLKTKILFEGLVVADSATKEMSKSQQITGGFVYSDDKVAIPILCNKLKAIVNHSQGDKIAIYAKYTYEIELLTRYLNAIEDVHEFKTSKHRYLVKQIKSGSKGIDLSFCDQHWFYSLDFSGETFIQATARMHNKKRDRPVEALILTTNGMIDKDVFNAVKTKDNFNTRLYKDLV